VLQCVARAKSRNRRVNVKRALVYVCQCVTVCCSVLQCVAVRCSALQCVAVRCSALHCVAVRCSVFQCVAVCCSEMTHTGLFV